MTTRTMIGDCRDKLKELAERSVHCIVTSPPYYGLRDYGVAGQIGLEPTPDAYVAELVAVFRECRRVLRDDGTLWLNLGSAYASGGKRSNQSPAPAHVPACDSDDIGQGDCSEPDYACSGQRDGSLDGSPSRHARTSDNGPSLSPDAPLSVPISHDSGRLDYVSASPAVSPLGVPQSNTRASFRRDRASVAPANAASGFPASRQTCEPCAPQSEDKGGSNHDNAEPSSAVRNRGRDVSGSACSCGSCGICWAYLAIPSLRFKSKDLMSIPHLVALALQADGWFLRSSIVWHKPNPMPESVRDRPTNAHEHVFLLSQSPTYYYDAEAVREPSANPEGSAVRYRLPFTGNNAAIDRQHTGQPQGVKKFDEKRNLRNVWTIATLPYVEAHFATFPPKLAERCILAGCPVGGTVLDPFGGAGTTGLVADRLQRNAVIIELNETYARLADHRITADAPLFAEILR